MNKVDIEAGLKYFGSKAWDEELQTLRFSFPDQLLSGVFQNIHDSYDELKSATLMAPKLLAMCGIVKRSHGEFQPKVELQLDFTRSQHQQSTDTNFATLHGFDLNNFGKSIVFDVNRLNQA